CEVNGDAAPDGVDVAFERAAHAERDDGHPLGGARADDGGYLVGRDGEGDGVRSCGRMPRFAVAVMIPHAVRRGEPLPQQAAQRVYDCNWDWHGYIENEAVIAFSSRYCIIFNVQVRV